MTTSCTTRLGRQVQGQVHVGPDRNSVMLRDMASCRVQVWPGQIGDPDNTQSQHARSESEI